jgi:hypothetical protein
MLILMLKGLAKSCSPTLTPMKTHFVPLPTLVLALATSVSAQTISESQMRAANLARMQAELINGGLNNYSPEKCMHEGGGGKCMVSETSQGYRFQFLGGPPGWDVKRQPPTIQTSVIVSPDGRSSSVEYNGPVRQTAKP